MDRNPAVLADAFLKRFESLVSQLQDQVWPRTALHEGEGPVPNLGFRDRLAHAYWHDSARIAARLNDAWATVPLVLRASETAEAWAVRRLSPPASP